MMSLEDVVLAFDGPRGGKYRCPVHDGYSLSISKGDKAPVLIHCFGCDASFSEIMDAAGFSKKDVKRLKRIKIRQPKHLRRDDLGPDAQSFFIRSWNDATNPDGHPYLQKKRVGAHNIRQIGPFLVMPAYNAENKLVGLQSVNWKGDKKFYGGSKAGGAFFYLTPVWADASHVWIAEGYATAATILKVAPEGVPVVCCFMASNLPKVAETLLANNPEQNIYIAADHDKSGTGYDYAMKALASGASYITMPDKQGTDWNDYMVEFGIEWTRDEIYGY